MAVESNMSPASNTEASNASNAPRSSINFKSHYRRFNVGQRSVVFNTIINFYIGPCTARHRSRCEGWVACPCYRQRLSCAAAAQRVTSTKRGAYTYTQRGK